MKDELITYDTATLAKEKGFDVLVIHYYTKFKNKFYISESEDYRSERLVESNWNDGRGSYPTSPKDVECSAPTQSLLQRWLREVHNIVITISHWTDQPVNGKVWKNCFDYNFQNLHHGTTPHKTYEEALEEALHEALKLIKL